ncbi:MAG TPA: hypothetical protein VLW84_09680 [Terriglobales bacterium]|nr:hypothetical protein [Methylomirabilota bacterium]HUJ95522.1 hypothetical protein [Terriglobales bacterium]
MTLLDAEQYDPSRERWRRLKIGGVVALVLVLAGVAWLNRNWIEERAVDRFFTALEQKNYEAAYGIWMHDPQWRQHRERYSQYPFNDFYRDWGPGGEWGLIKSHKIYGSINPSGGSSGVIVDVIVNERTEHARIWVQKSDKTLSFSPY